MEYFNFEDASHLDVLPDFDEISSTCPEANEDDSQSCFEALFFDKSSGLPIDQPAVTARLLWLVGLQPGVRAAPDAERRALRAR